MNAGNPVHLLAVSFDWEALIPILFFLLYGLAQFFGSKKKGGEEEIPVEDEEAVDPMERARQIREDIQRKIQERRDAAGTATDPTMGRQPQVQPPYDPTVPESAPQPAQSPPPNTPQPVQRAQPAAGSSRELNIEERLRRQQERLREARKRQEEARRKARSMQDRAGLGQGRQLLQPVKRSKAAAAPDLLRPAALRQQVIDGVRDPNSLRKAILYQEILGTPVSLRPLRRGAPQAGPIH
jgi:hypothetical protein